MFFILLLFFLSYLYFFLCFSIIFILFLLNLYPQLVCIHIGQFYFLAFSLFSDKQKYQQNHEKPCRTRKGPYEGQKLQMNLMSYVSYHLYSINIKLRSFITCYQLGSMVSLSFILSNSRAFLLIFITFMHTFIQVDRGYICTHHFSKKLNSKSDFYSDSH